MVDHTYLSHRSVWAGPTLRKVGPRLLDATSHLELDGELENLRRLLLIKRTPYGTVASAALRIIELIKAGPGDDGWQTKLIRQNAEQNWTNSGCVMSAWFGDLNKPVNKGLHEVCTALFRLVYSGSTPHRKQKYSDELREVLSDYLSLRGCSVHGANVEETTPGASQQTRESESAESPTGATAATGHLKPSREKAYQQFQWAMDTNPALKTDREVYDWLKERPDFHEELPRLATWSKYLREARAFYQDHKHTPRTTRKALGKSVVRRDQI